jgi:hypothetical protein
LGRCSFHAPRLKATKIANDWLDGLSLLIGEELVNGNAGVQAGSFLKINDVEVAAYGERCCRLTVEDLSSKDKGLHPSRSLANSMNLGPLSCIAASAITAMARASLSIQYNALDGGVTSSKGMRRHA